MRFVPALMERVGCPHWAQKGFRAFQSRRARAWAYIAAVGAGRDMCIRPVTKFSLREVRVEMRSLAAVVMLPFGVTSRAK